jgi:copper chaperone NosL
VKARAAMMAMVLTACAPAPGPAPLDTRNDACAECRMAISDARLAAQIVAPAEEPRFFDEVGCLRAYLKAHPQHLPGATAYVADHRTGAWVPAVGAVYVRVPGLQTPMGGAILAHADAASRDQDDRAQGGTAMTPDEVFGPGGRP